MNFQELYYDADDIAYYIVRRDMGTREKASFVDWLYEKEYEFIKSKYKKDKRKFLLDIDFFANYIIDSGGINEELDLIENDYSSMGRTLDKEKMIPDYWKFHSLPFKILRLDIAYGGSQERSTTLRELIREHDQSQQESFQLMHILNCLLFYHIQPYMTDHSECNISKISPDDMIVFTIS